MKIEKINENQIRCTLTKEDLIDRKIRLSELAYGSEKAKSLFRDMMQQAADDFGFEANNIPLMIEAIPISSDSIILIITKVEDPEELDTRFSRFTGEEERPEADRTSSSLAEALTGADDILDLIQKIHQARQLAAKAALPETEKEKDSQEPQESPEASEEIFHLTRFYLFRDLETVIRASRVLSSGYTGPNALFKNPEDQNYYLLLKKADTDPGQFNKICNVLSEYALQVSYTPGMEEYFTEHMEVIIPDSAVQHLRNI